MSRHRGGIRERKVGDPEVLIFAVPLQAVYAGVPHAAPFRLRPDSN